MIGQTNRQTEITALYIQITDQQLYSILEIEQTKRKLKKMKVRINIIRVKIKNAKEERKEKERKIIKEMKG